MFWCQGAQNVGLSNRKLKFALKCTVWSQCTRIPDRQTDRRTNIMAIARWFVLWTHHALKTNNVKLLRNWNTSTSLLRHRLPKRWLDAPTAAVTGRLVVYIRLSSRSPWVSAQSFNPTSACSAWQYSARRPLCEFACTHMARVHSNSSYTGSQFSALYVTESSV